MGAAFPGNTVSNHTAGKQVEDNAEIQGIVLNLEIGNVADPHLIRPAGYYILYQIRVRGQVVPRIRGSRLPFLLSELK